MRLTGRTVLITGGGGGIGLALARELASRGNVVIATGRDPARLQAAKAALPALHAIESDVARPGDVDSLHARVTADFPALDMLVNNAGIMRNVQLRDARDLDDIAREIDIDLTGPVRMVQRFLPHLLQRPEALIVNVTSGIAFVPMPASPVYSAAKAGLRAYTRSLRWQLSKTNVRVVEVAPPPVETPLFRDLMSAETANTKGMDPARLAASVMAGLEAGRDEIVPGIAKALAAMARIAPRFAFDQMTRLSWPKPAP